MLLADKLAPLVFTNLHELCSQWNECFPEDLRLLQSPYFVSSHAVKNVRRKMEDRHVILPYLNQTFSLPEVVTFYMFLQNIDLLVFILVVGECK